jgi:hypothetical protein
VPRQVRQLARKSAFNARARENAIYVIDTFAFETPKTKQLVELITRLGVADQKVLILTDGVKQNVFLSGRNLPTVHVMPYSDVSTYHLLWSDVVLIEAGALGSQLEPAEGGEADGREARGGTGTRGAKSARKAASRAGAKKAATRGAAKKAAAKRPAAKKTAAKKSASKSTKKKGR